MITVPFQRLFVLTLLLIGMIFSSAHAQSRSKKSTTLSEHLWYGGSVGLGFQSFNNQSSFLFALFPMMGYKITESISVGPRIGASYRNIKSRGLDGRVYRFNPVELSGALFGRVKLFRQIFGHVEYELASEKNLVNNSANGISIRNGTETNFYLGGGYNSGGKIASEIYILYNFNEDDFSLEVPWVIRAGFTYRF